MNLSASIPFLNNISLRDKVFFTRHLSVMLKSGIPISEAITSLMSQSSNPAFKKTLKLISQGVLNGQSLEKSLAKSPKVFDSFYIYMVKVGEESGNLEKNLEYLVTHLKKDAEFKKKVFNASLYPSIVIATAVIVGGGISLFVLPKLIDLFKSLDVKLPLSTKILLFFAQTMKDYGIFIFGFLIFLVLLIRFLITIASIKFIWQKIWLSAPVIGPFLQNVQMSQLCRNLGIMVKSGLPISQALEIQTQTTSNLIFKNYLNRIQKGVEKGESIGEVLRSKRYKYFPTIAMSMIEVGEKTGKLDESLEYLGDFFEEEVDDAAKNLTTTLEPILLLVVGLIVAFMAMAIISPIYQFTGSINR